MGGQTVTIQFDGEADRPHLRDRHPCSLVACRGGADSLCLLGDDAVAATGRSHHRHNGGRQGGGEEAAAEEDDADAAPPPSPPPLGSLATRGTLLLLGYLANWLPFIPVKRAAFLYHFLPALVHALLLLGVLLDIAIPSNLPILHTRSNPTDSRLLEQILPSTGGILASGLNAPSGGRWLVSSALIYLMASCFAYFAPLAYGMPLSHEEFDARMWLEGWR